MGEVNVKDFMEQALGGLSKTSSLLESLLASEIVVKTLRELASTAIRTIIAPEGYEFTVMPDSVSGCLNKGDYLPVKHNDEAILIVRESVKPDEGVKTPGDLLVVDENRNLILVQQGSIADTKSWAIGYQVPSPPELYLGLRSKD